MNVFEIAHQVNDRLYDGDGSKFEMVFIIVSEFLSSYKPYCRLQFAKEKLLSGYFDNSIVEMIDAYMNGPIPSEDRLLIINYFHESFKNFRDILAEPFFDLDLIPQLDNFRDIFPERFYNLDQALGGDIDDYMPEFAQDFAPANYYEAS